MILYPFQGLTLKREDSVHWFFLCPFHKEEHGSLVVNKIEPYRLFYKCFGCGVYGSARDFAYRYLQHDRKSIEINLSGQRDLESPMKKIIKPKINWDALRGCPLKHIPDEEQKLSQLVGVSMETIRKFGIGWRDGRFLIPMYDENGICGISVRYYMFEKEQNPPWVCHKRCIKGSKHGWFRPNDCCITTDKRIPLFITEGWSDCAVMCELGYSAVIGRFNALQLLPESFKQEQYRQPTYIISDTDECGIKGSRGLQKLIGGKIIVMPPIKVEKGDCIFNELPKDIRELYLRWGKEKTKCWLEAQL